MKIVLLISVLIFSINGLFAQSKKGDFKFFDVANIRIDGELNDWVNMHHIGEDTSWSFAVGKDEKYIYVAVQVNNSMLQVEAARNGILVNINTIGKKRDGAQLVFPIPDSESVRAMREDEELKPEDVKKELINRTRGYMVKGFPMIVDGLLSYENTYQVKAVSKISENDKFIYEAIIPIEQLRLKDKNQTLAVQVMINNRWAYMKKVLAERARSQRSPYYGGMMSSPTVKTPFKGKTDVWIIDKL